jgi:hypothetical protein
MGKIRGTLCMRSHISAHRATTKYFCNSFVFKTNIEKEGLPRDHTPALGAADPTPFTQEVAGSSPGAPATFHSCLTERIKLRNQSLKDQHFLSCEHRRVASSSDSWLRRWLVLDAFRDDHATLPCPNRAPTNRYACRIRSSENGLPIGGEVPLGVLRARSCAK